MMACSKSQSRCVVFLGPSLPAAEAGALLPGADIRPPVRLGDLYALMASPAETILIIDGVFHADTPVWPREILAALEAGKRVVGAASMGALRALELAPYGMLGVGTVVRWYRDGVIQGDDEVALLHGDAEMDYRPLTLPLVDLRFGLGAMESAGELTPEAVSALLAGMKQLSHAQRTRKALCDLAARLGLPDSAQAALRRRFARPDAGVKAADARLALRLCATPERLPAAAEIGREAACPPNASLDRPEPTLLRRCGDDPRAPRVRDVLAASAREPEATARRRREASRRWFLCDWCDATGHGPSQADYDAFVADWLDRHAAPAEQAAWLQRNALRWSELHAWLRGRCIEAWLCEQTPEALGLPPGPPACPMIPQVLADWAARHGAIPPAEVGRDPEAIATWIVQSGPGYFGAIDWDPDVAIARELQVTGTIAPLAETLVQTEGQAPCPVT